MPHVYIQESHWDQFNKIEDFLSPGDSASFILLGRDIDSIIFPNIRVFKLRVGCWMMDYLGIWIYCIMAHGIDVKNHIFIPNVTTGVQPLQ